MRANSKFDRPLFDFQGGALCLDFLNTYNHLPGARTPDSLGSYRDFLAWCVQARILDPQQARRLADEAEKEAGRASAILEHGTALRQSFYRLFAALAAGERPPDPAELQLLNETLPGMNAYRRLAPSPQGVKWQWRFPASDLSAPLAPVIVDAAELLTTGPLERLRECAGRSCTWIFLDRTRNRSRRWCDMKVCGNREKVRRFRKRQSR